MSIFSTISNFFNGAALQALAANFDAADEEITARLRRDGTTSMQGNLDMDSNRVYNLRDGVAETDAATVQQLRTIPKGDPGAAGNVAADLMQLKAAAVTNVTMLFDGATFSWTIGNYAGLADDINVVASNFFPLTTGAWVRQSASKIAYKGAGTTPAQLDLFSKVNQTLSTDDKAGANLKAQLDAVGVDFVAGGRVELPNGQRSLGTTGFKFEGQRLAIEGKGRYGSTINFNPTVAGSAAIEYNNPTPGGLYQGSIENVGFNSGNAINKTAIRLVNCADVTVSGIAIATNAWQGSGSVGLEVFGRQSLHFHTAQIACARPLWIRKNPIFTTLNTDHFLLEHLELTTTEATGSAVFIDPDVMVTTCTMGPMALTGGKYGIYYSESGSGGTSYGFVIDRVRREQAADPTGYSVYLAASTTGIQSVTIKNCYFVNTQGGVYLRKAQKVSIRDTTFAMNASYAAIDMEFVPGSSLILDNCVIEGGTLNLDNAICIKRVRGSRGVYEHWIYKADPSSGGTVSETYDGGAPYTLAADGVQEIGGNTFVGWADITSSENVGGTFFFNGTNLSVKEVYDSDGFFTLTKDSANSYNVYWDASLLRFVVQNKRAGGAKELRIHKRGNG